MTTPTNTIHEILSNRRSPYAIDPERKVVSEDLAAVFEAARWTMSAFNAQPWRYIVGVKGNDDGVWQQIHDALMEGNQPWTANAPVLAVGLVQKSFEHNGQPNGTALHDLGAASASLTFEAGSRGLSVHQMSGVYAEKVIETFGIDDSLEPITALAIGYAGKPDVVDAAYAERDAKPRERKPLDEIIIQGSF